MKALLTGMEWLPDLPGGLNRYLHGLMYALPNVGVTGTVAVSHLTGKNPAPQAESDPFRVVPMAADGAPLLHKWKGARQIMRDALRQGVDVVNSHFAMYAFPFVRMLPGDVPLVVNFQGPWADELGAEESGLRTSVKHAIARRIELAVYRRATRFITLSAAFARILEERYGIAAERIRVVPGALDLRPYLATPDRAEARQRLGWPNDRPILVSVRRLVRRMGLESLIDSIEQVRRQHPDVLLLIGGSGPIGEELQQRIRIAKLTDHVRLLGVIPEADLPLAYAAADMSIVPTLKLEGFGLVTAESLGAGTPVLGTPVGATPEILTDLSPALVFDSTSADAMAERINAVLRGQVRLPSRQECRDYAGRYGWQAVAPRVKAIYDEAVRDGRP